MVFFYMFHGLFYHVSSFSWVFMVVSMFFLWFSSSFQDHPGRPPPFDQPATDTRRTRRSFGTKAFAPKSAAEERQEEPKEGDEGGELWVNDHKFTGIMVYHD